MQARAKSMFLFLLALEILQEPLLKPSPQSVQMPLAAAEYRPTDVPESKPSLLGFVWDPQQVGVRASPALPPYLCPITVARPGLSAESRGGHLEARVVPGICWLHTESSRREKVIFPVLTNHLPAGKEASRLWAAAL